MYAIDAMWLAIDVVIAWMYPLSIHNTQRTKYILPLFTFTTHQ
jgi:hypothetical protein